MNLEQNIFLQILKHIKGYRLRISNFEKNRKSYFHNILYYGVLACRSWVQLETERSLPKSSVVFLVISNFFVRTFDPKEMSPFMRKIISHNFWNTWNIGERYRYLKSVFNTLSNGRGLWWIQIIKVLVTFWICLFGYFMSVYQLPMAHFRRCTGRCAHSKNQGLYSMF